MKLDLFEGTVKAYLVPNENHPDYRVEVGEFSSIEEADIYIAGNSILAKYPTKEKKIEFIGTHDEPRFRFSLVEREIKEELGEFDSIEALNEHIISTGIPHNYPNKVLVLEFTGLAGGRYPTSDRYWRFDCEPVGEEAWAGIRDMIEKVAEFTINDTENGNFEVEGIPFHFSLEVNSASDASIFEGEFANIYRINEFIRSTMAKPEYIDAIATLWPMEVVGDICSGASYGYTLERYDVISDEVSNDIGNYILEKIEEREQYNGYVEVPMNPELFVEPEDYTKKQALRNEYTYICPTCLHELEDCRCGRYPWTVVQIDTILLPVIQELNWKGYRTAHSCSGHKPGEQMYIAFQHDYYPPVPEKFYYSSSDFVVFRPCPEGLSDEDYRAFRQESADILLKWAEGLRVCLWPDGNY